MKKIISAINQLLKHLADRTGRQEFLLKLKHRTWPFSGILAKLYRNSIVRKVKFIVIIGSLGKTTTTKTIKTMLEGKVENKSYSNQFGALSFSILSTNPFQKIKVFEVAISRPGQMEIIGKIIKPDVLIFTSVGLDHVPDFDGIEQIRDEKAKMISFLRKDGTLLVNGDDKLVMQKAIQSGREFLSFGFGENNHVRCINAEPNFPFGTNCIIQCGAKKFEVQWKLTGTKMVYPLLAALGVAQLLNFSVEKAVKNLNKVKAAPGRMQIEILPGGAIVLGDFYKATVDSVKPALKLFAESKANRKILIFGDLGYLRGNFKNTCLTLGKKLATIADFAIFSGEMEQAFFEGITAGGMNPENVILAGESMDNLLNLLPVDLNQNDVIYISGRVAQKMERVFLKLKGVPVRCTLNACNLFSYCKDCSRL